MIGIAIIGVGDIANTHIESYSKFGKRCKVKMLVDRLADKAQEKKDKYGLDCDISADYRDILTRDDITLVSICLPPALHCQIVCELLLAGKHVLCEKPMAPTLEECDLMIEAEKKGHGKLAIVAQSRFKPDIMKTKALIDEGSLGDILVAQVNSLWWRGSHYYDLCWRGTWEKEGGGCTFSHAVHHIDLFLWLMGDIKNISAMVTNQNHLNSEVEDLSISRIQFESGAVGLVVCSLLHHGEEQKVIIDAKNGTIEIPHKIAVSKQQDNGYPQIDVEKQNELEAIFQNMSDLVYTDHDGQIENMLIAIEQDIAPLVTGEAGRKTIEFIAGAYQSSFTGKTVTLPMTKDDPFYTKEGVMNGAVKFFEKTVSVESFKDIGISVGGSL